MYGTRRLRLNAEADRNKAEAQREHDKADIWQQKFAGRTLASDLAALGLSELPAADAAIEQAWRLMVKAKFGSGADMDELKQARDRLLLALSKGAHERLNQINDSTCKACAGSGRIGVGFGQECPTCKGTGQRNGT